MTDRRGNAPSAPYEGMARKTAIPFYFIAFALKRPRFPLVIFLYSLFYTPEPERIQPFIFIIICPFIVFRQCLKPSTSTAACYKRPFIESLPPFLGKISVRNRHCRWLSARSSASGLISQGCTEFLRDFTATP